MLLSRQCPVSREPSSQLPHRQQQLRAPGVRIGHVSSARRLREVRNTRTRVVPAEVSVIGISALVAGTITTIKYCRELLLGIYSAVASSRPNPGQFYLSGNYAPVDSEVHVTEGLPVEGIIPAELEGMYLRAGPNPMLKPSGGYYLADGDGMVHGVRLSGGRACSYANHAVRTARLLQEQKAGRPFWPKIGDLWGWPGVLFLVLTKVLQELKTYDMTDGAGTANTSVLYHANKLLALYESDLPYQMRVRPDGAIETVGRLPVRNNDSLPAWSSPVTAHPKIDPETGEMFIFGYSFNDTRVQAGMVDSTGQLTKQWVIDTPYSSMMHDCGLTKNYAVLIHMPITIDGESMVRKETLPLVFKRELGSRVGLLRRDAPCFTGKPEEGNLTPVQWFDLPTGFVFHVANSWEDSEGRVHVVTCHFEEFHFHDFHSKTPVPPPESERPQLTEYVLDPATGKTLAVNKLSDLFFDFPVVHPGKVGLPSRYVYGAILEYPSHSPYMSGIAKFDLTMPRGQDACVAVIPYPAECAGGEALFVPRKSDSQWGTAEDDGWLLVYVHDSVSNQSSLNIYDAKTMNPEPLARVLLPQRVPFGFHGTWLTSEQLESLTASERTEEQGTASSGVGQLQRAYSG